MRSSRTVRTILVFLAAALLLLPFLAAADPVSKEFRKEIPVKPGAVVTLENLAGKVTVEGTREGPAVIEATLHGEYAELLSELSVDVSESGGKIEVTAKYPVDRHDVFRYEGDEHGSSGWSSTSATYLGRKVKVVSGSGRGVALWADFHLRLPAGTGAEVRNEVGRISASDVNGPLTARTGSGSVRVEGGEGSAMARSGSGNVTVKGRKGSVEARTGSGDVALLDVAGTATVQTGSGNADLEGVTGPVDAETGSGSVTLKGIEGERVRARTGSGEITLRGAKGILDIGTGSGSIRGEELAVAGSLDLHTGSGDIRLSGDFGGLKGANVRTSSGEVVLRMAKAPGMNLSCRTTSGDIDVDLMGTKLRTERKLEVAVGGGGAPVTVHTSSGSIRIEGK